MAIVQPAVEVRGLSKQYPGVLALDRASLTVEAGKLFALLGPNGAGKTTLMRILTTQIEATSGTARVLGMDVSAQGANVRRLAGYVPQEVSVWTDITGYENLLIYSKIYGIDERKRDGAIASALKTMGMNTVADRLVGNYSGGMIRKLEIASAIMMEPQVLFLDEPTIGLDPMARRAVWEKLSSLNRRLGTSVFFSTHYMDEADSYADNIGIISRGRIMKVGTPQELKESVGSETVSIGTAGRVGRGIAARIRGIEGITGVRIGDGRLEVSARHGDEAINPVMQLLLSQGVKVKSVSTSSPTLDDVFLKYGRGSEQKVAMAELRKMRDRIKRG